MSVAGIRKSFGGSIRPNNKLIGSYRVRLDEKSRFVLPKPLRSKFPGGKLYLVVYDKEHAKIFPEAVWENYAEKLDEDKRKQFYARSFELKMDAQGRVVIPQIVMEKSEFKKESTLIIAGVGDYMELWSGEKWLNRQSGF